MHRSVVFRLLFALAPLLAACSPASSAGASPTPSAQAGTERPLESVVLRLSYLVAGHHAPIFLGLERGYFEREGIRLEVYEGRGSLATAQLIGAGQGGDIGYVDYATMARAVGSGVPVKALYGVMEKNPLGIVTLESSGIKTPQDMRGKRIIMVPGGAETVLVPAFLATQGMQLSDVKATFAQSGQSGSTLMFAGQTDIAFSFTTDGWAGYQAQKENKPIRAFMFADYGLAVLNHGFIANNDTIAKKADMLKRFFRAYSAALKDAVADPGAAVKALLRRYPDKNPDLVALEWKNTIDTLHTARTQSKPYGWMAPEDWQDTVGILQKYGQMDKVASMDQYYTNDFVPQ